MKFPGMVGGSYTSQSLSADAQITRNLYPEKVESGRGKNDYVLYPTPGLKLFATIDPPVRGQFYVPSANRYFAVGGSKLYEITYNPATGLGTPKVISTIALQNDALPVSMAASLGASIQLAIAAGPQGAIYVYNLATNTFTSLSSGTITNVGQIKFSDGFFIAVQKNSNQFQMSAILDATTWPGIQVNAISVFSDNIQGIEIDHRELFIFGSKASVAYYLSGSNNIYDVIPSSFFERGCGAPNSITKLDNTVCFLQSDDRGNAVGVKMQGYTPVRVSNHAVENAWRGYGKVSDAVGYAYQENGHEFWVIYFPTPSKTWCLDMATMMWHERDGFNAKAHPSQNHVFASGFGAGLHLVGDWSSGNIYQQSVSFLDYNGTTIRRVRRAPHLCNEQKWIWYDKLIVDVETGVGVIPPPLDGSGNPRAPQLMLRISNDGGHTFGDEQIKDCGQAGQFKQRVVFRRGGRSRDRVYELAMSDPVRWALIDSYLETR